MSAPLTPVTTPSTGTVIGISGAPDLMSAPLTPVTTPSTGTVIGISGAPDPSGWHIGSLHMGNNSGFSIG